MVVLESQFKKMVFKYKYRDLIVCEIVNVIILYKDFKFVLDLYVFNDGSFRELMNFIGIIFVFYRGNIYNILICLWLLDIYLYNFFICFVKFISLMIIKIGKYVDVNGKIYFFYLYEWKYLQLDLLGFIQVMIVVFGDEFLVFFCFILVFYLLYQVMGLLNIFYMLGMLGGIFLYLFGYFFNFSGYLGCFYLFGGLYFVIISFQYFFQFFVIIVGFSRDGIISEDII